MTDLDEGSIPVQSSVISVNEYRWERLLGQFDRTLRRMAASRRPADTHGADVLVSVVSILKAITDNDQAPSVQASRFRDELKARAEERRQNPSQQNEADVLDVAYRAFMVNVMEVIPANDGAVMPDGFDDSVTVSQPQAEAEGFVSAVDQGEIEIVAPMAPPTNQVTTATGHNTFNEQRAGNAATRLVEDVIDKIEMNKKKATLSSVWLALGALVETSIIVDTQPGKYLCDVGNDDLYPITKGSIRGVLQRRRARLKHA
ncbi:MAG: hypothetical protein K8H75_06505 [Sulfuricella sp.]|nr:hypothetical protein [Sulfuricella sp.]